MIKPNFKVAVVHDSGFGGDDRPYHVGEMHGFQRIVASGFVSFAEARAWALGRGFDLWNEEVWVWAPICPLDVRDRMNAHA
jgi:hypothetical protein